MMQRHHILLSLLALSLTGCPIGNNKYPRPVDLNPAWKVDRLRVLGIRAEPPEAKPGELVSFQALVVDPESSASVTAWLACAPDEGSTDFGCALDSDFDFTSASADDLTDAGFIGFEPTIPPRYVPPASLLDGLDEGFEADRGVQVTIQILVLPQTVVEHGFEDGFDFNQVEAAFKRLIVSDDDSPNANPDVAGFAVDGMPIPPGTIAEVDRSQVYEIGLALQDGAVEAYVYTNEEGAIEERVEQPYALWYTTGGDLLEDATLFPFLEATWRAPGEDGPEEGTLWAVVRDRRGGLAWSSLQWRIR